MKYTGIIVKFSEQPDYYVGQQRVKAPLVNGRRTMTYKVDEGSVVIKNKLVSITVNEDGTFNVEHNSKNKIQ